MCFGNLSYRTYGNHSKTRVKQAWPDDSFELSIEIRNSRVESGILFGSSSSFSDQRRPGKMGIHNTVDFRVIIFVLEFRVKKMSNNVIDSSRIFNTIYSRYVIVIYHSEINDVDDKRGRRRTAPNARYFGSY